MAHDEQKKSIGNEVLSAIKTGAVQMRPRWHFVLQAALLATGVVLLLGALVYLVSFILFASEQTGVWFAPGFGGRGWFIFFRSFPWFLALVVAAFIVILELLVRRYSFAYRRPLLYSALGILLVVLIGGGALGRTALHPHLFRDARMHQLPFAEPFYRGFGMQRFGDIRRGIVVATTSSGFTLADIEGVTSSVFISPATRLPFGEDFASGDSVVVIGEASGTEIAAFGIREVSE